MCLLFLSIHLSSFLLALRQDLVRATHNTQLGIHRSFTVCLVLSVCLSVCPSLQLSYTYVPTNVSFNGQHYLWILPKEDECHRLSCGCISKRSLYNFVIFWDLWASVVYWFLGGDKGEPSHFKSICQTCDMPRSWTHDMSTGSFSAVGIWWTCYFSLKWVTNIKLWKTDSKKTSRYSLHSHQWESINWYWTSH